MFSYVLCLWIQYHCTTEGAVDRLDYVWVDYILSWIVLGDFNNVLSASEKKGGLSVTNYGIKDFVDCFNVLDLLDMKYVGCTFTWMSSSVCCKLDRVLVNPTWMRSDFDALAEFVAPGCVFDHSCIVVSLLESRIKQSKPFKFFNMWTLSDDFLNIVARKW